MSNQTPGTGSTRAVGPGRGRAALRVLAGVFICVVIVCVQQAGLLGSGRGGVESGGVVGDRSGLESGSGSDSGGSTTGESSRGSARARAASESRVLGADELLKASKERRTDLMVRASGRVKKILPDDALGVRHQRFIVSLGNGLTVLIAHNLELSTRVPVKEGSGVEFKGEYEWNDEGGIVHWTHRDPGKRHMDGWIKFDGKTHQ